MNPEDSAMKDKEQLVTAETVVTPESHQQFNAEVPTEPNFHFGNLVILLVGPIEYRFDVHKDHLSRASAFFKAAFKGNFKEREGVIRLPEQEVSTFKFFIYWLYRRQLRGFCYPDTLTPSLTQLKQEVKKEKDSLNLDCLPWDNPVQKRLDLANYKDVPFLSLVKLYILADTLQVAGLQDHVISVIDEVYYPTFSEKSLFWQQGDNREDGLEHPLASVKLAWTMTSINGNLCDLLINIFCDHVPNLSKAPFDGGLPTDFLAHCYSACWQKLDDLQKGVRGDDYNVCDYHKHDAGCPEEFSDFPRYI